MSRLGTETAFEVLARAKQLEAAGRRIVHLEIGEPDFDTPSHIVAAAVDALQNGWHHYTPAAGILPLREAIAEDVGRSRGISVHPDHVVVTPGGKPILFFALLALAEPGCQVIYPNPGFPIYESMIRFAGAEPVPVPLREELEFRVDPEELVSLVGPRTRLIILNSPNNPTGSVLDPPDLGAIAAGLRDRDDIFVLSDEIYSRLLYEGDHVSISSLPGMRERTIILDGFSKTFAMTGWRLGYGVMPADLAAHITRLMINSNSCTAAFTQVAGVAALQGEQEPVDRMLATFRERRDRVVGLLNEIEGMSCRTPRGAFYVFPAIRGLESSSADFANLLLEKYGTAVLAGTAFGRYGEGYLRLSYATSLEFLEEGIARIGEACRALRGQTATLKADRI
jgi:aspartate aminotransferase